MIYYLYEQTGMIGFELNGTPYYYVRNLQGDVTKILAANGSVVVQYSYDSWGKILSVTGSLASTVGAKNPIRYRGYYYDTETELYYLNSRYYDPETGRFISPDVVAEGGNLYTYCTNDPVNRSDDSGYLSKFWKRFIHIAVCAVVITATIAVTVATGGATAPLIAFAVAGGVINGSASIAKQLSVGDSVDWGDFATSFATGMAFGSLGATALTPIGLAGAFGIGGTLNSLANNWIEDENYNYEKAFYSGIYSSAIGGISGGGAQKDGPITLFEAINSIAEQSPFSVIAEFFQRILFG